MASIDPYIKLALQRGAKQLVLRPNKKPTLVFQDSSNEIGQPIHPSQIRVAVLETLSAEDKNTFINMGQINAIYTTAEFRVQVVCRPTPGGLEAFFATTVKEKEEKPPQRKSSVELAPLDESKFEESLSQPEEMVISHQPNMHVDVAAEKEVPNVKPSPAPNVSHMSLKEIDKFLTKMVKDGASDVHLCSNRHPSYRIDGDLVQDRSVPPFETDALKKLLFEIVRPEEEKDFNEKGSCDFAYEIPNLSRYRFNIYKDKRGLAGVVRQIPSKILTAEQLNLPNPVRALAGLPKGLVLVTGPTGSGKSTTLAAIVDLVNRTRTDHILTIESPIEFVHEDKKCLVNQREVGTHTGGFKEALRDSLREDPDVILVGELRDLETIETAIETASTGHLVFGTLHTTTAPSTVNRIIEIFPAEQQSQVRHGLAESLKAVIAQTLLKKIGGGRVAALEILMITPSVSNLIREQKTHQLLNVMQTGRKLGMQLLTEELTRLVVQKQVEPLEAYMKAIDKEEFLRSLAANGVTYTPPTELEMMGLSEDGE